ncbi:MAG: DNA/RNA non-specific endonuclease [Pseudomonadota bacterium]|nr:DNA/RNA non-specific endonuclease [Pseudomonadota bacterium]
MMPDMTSLRREIRYGMPAADQIMFNRYYVLGYSYYFRQAKWAIEIVNSEESEIERSDNFRPDYRVPEMFRADLADYANSQFDRGHLVASANKRETEIQNSETFLLSNMSPQQPKFNRKKWKELEELVRKLDAKNNILETYVICGPIFDYNKSVRTIGSTDDNGVTLPVPHSYFKSILTENNRGKLHMWSFILPNQNITKPLEDFQAPTTMVERMAGLFLWEHLSGTKIKKEKNSIRKMWA